jgi:uncharacterized repeat protein (TIGR01451 family)
VNFVNISGTNAATSPTFALQLSPNLGGVLITSTVLGTGSYSTTTGVVTFGTTTLATLAANGTVSASISYTQGTTTVTGTGTTGAVNDTNTGNNTGTFSVTGSTADVSTSFVGFPANAVVGTTVTGTVNFVNVTSNQIVTPTFSLKLTPGLSNVVISSVLLGSGTYTTATGVVTFNTSTLASLAANATASASISFTQTSTGVAGTGTSSAVNDSNSANNTATFNVALNSADMAVSFTGFPASAVPGATVSGVVNFANISATVVSSPTFTLQLKSGLGSVVVTSTVLGAGTYNTTTGVVTFASSVGSVTANTTITASISFTLASSGVAGTGTTGASNDNNSANNTATFSVAASAADMSVSFASFPSSATVSTTVSGILNFSNAGANSASTPTFALTLSTNLQTVTISSTVLGAGTYNASTGVVTFANAAPATLAAGGSVSVNISYFQPSSTVTLVATTGAVNDTNSANNTATLSIAAVTPSLADVSTTLVLPDSATPSQVVTITVTWTNNGPNPAQNVVGTVIMPNGTVTTTPIGSLNVGSSTVTYFTYTIPATSETAQLFTAGVATSTTEKVTVNNTVTATISLITVADLQTFISVTDTSTPGLTITANITILNNGPSTAKNVTTTLIFPNGTATIVITVPTLVKGATASATVSYVVPLSQGTTMTWVAGVTSTVMDSNTANNTVTAITKVAQIRTASLSGRAWLDVNADKVYTQGQDFPLVNWKVELIQTTGATTTTSSGSRAAGAPAATTAVSPTLNGTAAAAATTLSPAAALIQRRQQPAAVVETLIATAITGADGKWLMEKLLPGTNYSVRFKNPAGQAVVTTPLNQARFTLNGNPSTGDTLNILSNSQGTLVGTQIDTVSLYVGDNTFDQNLPIDPTGLIYDAVTRKPIAGAVVTILGPDNNPVDPKLILQNANQITTDASGAYQFDLLTSGPDGIYTLKVDPPTGYAVPPAQLGGVAKPQGVLTTPLGIAFLAVQPQGQPPAVGVNGVAPVGLLGTQYYFQFNLVLNSSNGGLGQSSGVVHNHIPLDPLTAGAILVSKSGDKNVAEVGDSVRYIINIRNTTGAPIAGVTLEDFMPAGFRLIPGTSRLNGTVTAEPTGGIGPNLVYNIGVLPGNTSYELSYFVRLGVGSQQGDGLNRAQGVFVGPNGRVLSNLAVFKVTVQGGVFSNDGCIVGKVYVDCDGDLVQSNNGGSREVGIPGVRLLMLDGSYIITDSEGKYSICGVPSQTHVVKVDRKTLPRGSRLVPSSNRNAGVGDSIFVDLKGGEMARADFIEGSCSPEVMDQVKARRAQGAVVVPEMEKGKPLKNDNLPGQPQQILPLPRQADAPVAAGGAKP